MKASGGVTDASFSNQCVTLFFDKIFTLFFLIQHATMISRVTHCSCTSKILLLLHRQSSECLELVTLFSPFKFSTTLELRSVSFMPIHSIF